MRVLHLTSSFPRSPDDSTAPFILDLARLESHAGLEVEVLAPHDRGLLVDETWGGVTVHRFRYGPQAWERLAHRGGLLAAVRRPLGAVMVAPYLLAFLGSALSRARAGRPEVLHAHWWFPSGLIAVLVGRLLALPVVVTVHGSDAGLAARPGLRRLARWVIRRATIVGTVSDALAAAMAPAAGGDSSRFDRLRLPVEPATGPPVVPPPPLPLRLVAVGRLTPEKGFATAVEAVNSLVREGVDVELDLMGDGPERARLAALAAPSGGRIRLHPAGTRREMTDRIDAAHALVVPSRREGLGLVAVEALARNRPVLASSVGGLPEVVTDGVDGIVVPPDDPAALATAIRRLPLPSPGADAVARHAPAAVLAAHVDAYQAALTAVTHAPGRSLRRTVGVLLTVGLVVALLRLVARDWPQVRDTVTGAGPGWLALTLAVVVVNESAFGLASALVFRRLVPAGPRRPGLLRVAAVYVVAQHGKHVPGAVWPAVARAGLARRWSVGARRVVAWIALESMGSVAASLLVAGAVLAAGGRPLLAAACGAAGAIAPLCLHPRSPLRALLARVLGAGEIPGARAVAGMVPLYLPVWVLNATAGALLATALVPAAAGRDVARIAGAAIVAAVVGFLAVPVPAGLGVREAVFVALTSGVLSTPVALAYALTGRVLALAVQIALALVALPLLRDGAATRSSTTASETNPA
ncbi:MAG TPA: glycosyltransferase [Acidimicrobiales bacterium]|nr:glycosyltransferase [Acidimicrobiales bacterium]